MVFLQLLARTFGLCYGVDNVTALFKDARPQENDNKDKADKEKPTEGITLYIEWLFPPPFEIVKNIHFRSLPGLEYGAALKPFGKSGPAYFP